MRKLEKEVWSYCPKCDKDRKFVFVGLLANFRDYGMYECEKCGQKVTNMYFENYAKLIKRWKRGGEDVYE